jgi:hypothetical protein
MKIRELDAAERERFSAQWVSLQARFVDYPKGAVTEAGELVSSLMQARGYCRPETTLRCRDARGIASRF